MKYNFTILICLFFTVVSGTYSEAREHLRFDDGWEFAYGNRADPMKDFGCGTEYFNYLTKAASIHNKGPYSFDFDKTKWGKEWKPVTLPHDWVVDLPFDSLASHSHGYKTVGYKFPETSVGWYRKKFNVKPESKGKHFSLRFDGIFRDARIWVNGFYLGNEPSGYATQVYDISEYLNYDGSDNLVAVRVDATLEEGWFYEGAGIYRHVWLDITDPVHVAPFGTSVSTNIISDADMAEVIVDCKIDNKSPQLTDYTLHHKLISPNGEIIGECSSTESALLPKDNRITTDKLGVNNPNLWDVNNPVLYKIETSVSVDGRIVDTYTTKFGIRDIKFDADSGFILNGRSVKLKGFNMHQDHAGVGTAIPDALQVYRLRQLKKLGANAYRASHNPMTPEMLDACDSLGILVIEENRLMGISDEHIRQLRRMIERDRNHPSIILWSVGNEEWGIEWKEKGKMITESMREYAHRLDSSRPVCVATSSGPSIVVTADVAGYNYMMQNPIEKHRAQYPERKAVGTEETTSCGTRGVYYSAHDRGHMVSLNRGKDRRDSTYNAIERGWKFYDERPWLGGIFYWTGFDYRGEPNPMSFPATGSQFGILDYCGFPKDEAYYIKSWWTDEPVLHIFPHWNLAGHEGELVSIWAYSNADEVELFVNGKSAGRKKMPENGHLEWSAVYQPGKLKAIAYKNGKRMMSKTVETTGNAEKVVVATDRKHISADNQDVAVITISLQDKEGRFVPDACLNLNLKINGPAKILGVGNGDPAYQAGERPADANARTYTVDSFNGLAQVLVQSSDLPGVISLDVSGDHLIPGTISIESK